MKIKQAAPDDIRTAPPFRIEDVRYWLGHSPVWAERAILELWRHQTVEERIAGQTVEHNGVGFNAFDADLLTSFADQITLSRAPVGARLSPRQFEIAFKRLPKYAAQLVALSNAEGQVAA